MNHVLTLLLAVSGLGAVPSPQEHSKPATRQLPTVRLIADPYQRSGKAVKYLLDRQLAGCCEDNPVYHTFQTILADFHVEFVDVNHTDVCMLDDVTRVAVGQSIIGTLNVCGCGCAVLDLQRILWQYQLEMLAGTTHIKPRGRLGAVSFPTEYERIVVKWIKAGKIKDGYTIRCPACSGLKTVSRYHSFFSSGMAQRDPCSYCEQKGVKRIWKSEYNQKSVRPIECECGNPECCGDCEVMR